LPFFLRSGAAAFFAGVLNNRPLPAAGRAGTGDGKETLAVTNLARTLAGGAYLFPRSVSRSGPFTGRAAFISGILDLNFGAENRIFKRYFNIVAKIGALFGAAVSAAAKAGTSAAPEKGIEDSGKIPKDILKPAEGLGKVLAAPHAFNTGMAELVVCGTLLIVRKDLVCFGCFLKLFLRFFIARVFIWVVLYGKFPVGFFYIVLGSALLNPQDFVIITFSHIITLYSSEIRK
jgi:hypothetical protein